MRRGVRRPNGWISASVVVIWAQRFEQTGSVAAKPSGGSTSPLEDHAEFLLALIAEQSDLTLDESFWRWGNEGLRVAAARCGGSSIDATSASKKTLGLGAKARRGGPRAPTLDARARHV